MFWICLLVVTISVKSDLVLVDTSDVRNAGLEHMIATGRKPGWVNNEPYVNFFSKAKPPSIFAEFWRFGENGAYAYGKNKLDYAKAAKNLLTSSIPIELYVGHVHEFITRRTQQDGRN